MPRLPIPTMNLKRLFLHNWEAKLVCLILATAIWWVLRYYVISGPGGLGTKPPAEGQAKP